MASFLCINDSDRLKNKNCKKLKIRTIINSFFTVFIAIFIVNTGISPELKAQEEFVLESRYLQSPDTVHVYTPGEKEEINYVFYLLHGWNGNYRQWGEIIDLEALAREHNIIIVCPDGFRDSWYFDAVKPDDSMYYATFFVKQLMPWVDSVYQTNDKKHYISGLSMGGYGALYLYLLYPDRFAAVASSSGAVSFEHPMMRDFGIEKRLGSYSGNTSQWKQMSVLSMIKRKKLNKNHHIYLDIGAQDPFLRDNQRLMDYLQMTQASAQLKIMEGGHNKSYWKKSLKYQIQLINQNVKFETFDN